MNKIILFFPGFFFGCIASFGQSFNNKMLFVIDSIPLFNDPEDWNPINTEDIADIFVIKNKDSLKLLGWEQLDGITYIFTKEYRNRPDSLKRIPSLKQLVMKNGVWNLNDSPYSGKYIDYYNSGRIQNEGTLISGKLNGKLIVYFKNGRIKSVSDYQDGVLHGFMNQYYKNGVLMQKSGYTEGKGNGLLEMYFINGQVEFEKKFKKETRYDTLIGYYSTGKIDRINLVKNDIRIRDKKENDLNYYTTKFTQSLQAGDIKAANRSFYQIWLIDSTSTATHLEEGMLLAREFHFDEAIAEFDKALAIEPLLRNALVERGLARIKKYQFIHAKSFSKNTKLILLTVEDIISVPTDEQVKICNDLQQADDLDPSDYYVKKQVSEAILNYCRKRSSY